MSRSQKNKNERSVWHAALGGRERHRGSLRRRRSASAFWTEAIDAAALVPGPHCPAPDRMART